jgi:hypothetical protein
VGRGEGYALHYCAGGGYICGLGGGEGGESGVEVADDQAAGGAGEQEVKFLPCNDGPSL